MDLLKMLFTSPEQFLVEEQRFDDRTHIAGVKIVRKPWGSERWLVPEGSGFGFKVITLHAGMRTSLQYHRIKEEANLILCGEGQLYLADTVGAPPVKCALAPGHVVHIRPGIVHRIEAITDLVIVEASTPELDDVVRVEDDMGRGDGRIESEHRGS